MKTPKHILVIRLSAMGDVAMTVAVLRVLRATYPELKITVLSKASFKVFFDDIENCHFLEADIYGRHKGFGILKLANEAKALGIDAVADLHQVIRAKIISTTLRLKGIRTSGINKGRSEKKALINANGQPISQLKTTHQRYADVFAKLGLPIDLKNHVFPEPKELGRNHHELIGKDPKKLIGIAPFAAYTSKMYPMKAMRKVIEQLDATKQYRILLFGSKEEGSKLVDFENTFSSVVSTAGKFTFSEELALLSNLDIMLSMDSGNGHLAAMFGIPVISLWGVTHPYAGFVPFGQPNSNQVVSNRDEFPLIPTSIYGNTFPKGYENVMQSIPVDLVVEKIQAAL